MSRQLLARPGRGPALGRPCHPAAGHPVNLRAAVSEVWDALLALGRGETFLPDNLTDRNLAQHMGRSERFVQKGLKGGELFGLYKRHRKYGRRNIEIIGRLMGRKDETKAAGPKPPFKPGAAKKGPAAIPPKPTTPEQAAAAAEAKRKAEANELPPPEPDFEGMTPAEIWAATRPKTAPGQAKLPRTMPKKE